MTWRERRVRDLVDLRNGFPFDSKSFSPHGEVPLVRIRDLLSEQFETFVPKISVPLEATLRDGDVAIGMDGDFNVVIWRRGSAALNQRLCSLRSNGLSDPRFIAYALPDHLRVINDLTYATTVKHLSSSQVLAIRLMAPPLDEQRAIADYLDEQTAKIDALIAKQEQMIELLEERRVAVVAERCLRGTNRDAEFVETGQDWLGSVPAHWYQSPLGSHFAERKEVGSATEYQPVSVTKKGVVPQLDTAAKSDSADARKVVRRGDFAINSRSDRKGSGGLSTLDGSTSVVYTVLIPAPSMDPRFAHHLLTCVPFQEEFYRWGSGIVADLWSTRFAAMKRITLAVPPRAEQAQISRQLDRETSQIDALIAKTREHIALAKERRSALITAAVTGQIDVRTATREVA